MRGSLGSASAGTARRQVVRLRAPPIAGAGLRRRFRRRRSRRGPRCRTTSRTRAAGGPDRRRVTRRRHLDRHRARIVAPGRPAPRRCGSAAGREALAEVGSERTGTGGFGAAGRAAGSACSGARRRGGLGGCGASADPWYGGGRNSAVPFSRAWARRSAAPASARTRLSKPCRTGAASSSRRTTASDLVISSSLSSAIRCRRSSTSWSARSRDCSR